MAKHGQNMSSLSNQQIRSYDSCVLMDPPTLISNFCVEMGSVAKVSQEHSACFQVKMTELIRRYDYIIQGVPGGMDKTSGECSLC